MDGHGGLAQGVEPSEQVGAHGRCVLDQAVFLDDLQRPVETNHIDEVAAPGGVDAAGGLEDVIFDLVEKVKHYTRDNPAKAPWRTLGFSD